MSTGSPRALLQSLTSSLNEIRRRISEIESRLGDIGSTGTLERAVGQRLSTDLLRGREADFRSLSRFLQRLSGRGSQSEILDLFFEEASQHVGRSMLLLREGPAFRPLRTRGFGATDFNDLRVEDTESPVFRAAEEHRILELAGDLASFVPWVPEAGRPGQSAVCIPMVFGDFVPVVLYVDSQTVIPVARLEFLSLVAGLVLKNHALVAYEAGASASAREFVVEDATQPAEPPAKNWERLAKAGRETLPAATRTPVDSAAPGMKESTAASIEGMGEVLAPAVEEIADLDASEQPDWKSLESDLWSSLESLRREPSTGREPAHAGDRRDEETARPEFEVQPTASELLRRELEEGPAAAGISDQEMDLASFGMSDADLEELIREASSTVVPGPKGARGEAPPGGIPIAVPEAAAGPAGGAEAPQEPSPAPPVGEAAPPELTPEELESHHSDARRFARLLVSELKLYNEEVVEEGRREGDLYDRLRDDIERSRQLYEKRVHPVVRSEVDYFHNEIVHILAKDDESRLGEAYSGSSITPPA